MKEMECTQCGAVYLGKVKPIKCVCESKEFVVKTEEVKETKELAIAS